MAFEKAPKTFSEQLDILESRGLTIWDRTFAEHCLRHHNYYRLSAYRFPFTEKGNPDQFLPNITFEKIWELYRFDRLLRILVSDAVKRVEISVRTNWSYGLSHAHGAFAYENASVFYDTNRHQKSLEKLDIELERSKEVFLKHYQQEYGLQRPPIWVACEVMSFGLLSRFYKNVSIGKLSKSMAQVYRLHPIVMVSFLEHVVYIRNLCAHHSRLWNRSFTITPSMPRHPNELVQSLNPSQDRKLYNTLVLLAHILKIIEPDNHWRQKLFEIIEDISWDVTPAMGFPSNWKSRPIWNLT